LTFFLYDVSSVSARSSIAPALIFKRNAMGTQLSEELATVPGLLTFQDCFVACGHVNTEVDMCDLFLTRKCRRRCTKNIAIGRACRCTQSRRYGHGARVTCTNNSRGKNAKTVLDASRRRESCLPGPANVAMEKSGALPGSISTADGCENNRIPHKLFLQGVGLASDLSI
jgi:hypothetical protein